MKNNMDFSVIIPVWRGAINSLPRLLDSIPEREGIEIIVVDNSKEKVSREEIDSRRKITFLYSDPKRHAGGSRNDGMNAAHGEWLVFADADDYFTPEAFDIFDGCKNSDADIVYFCADGIFLETGERSEQADLYARLVRNYLNDSSKEWDLRLSFHVPWAKMVRRSFVEGHGLRYDEVVANNDDYFALQAGFYAKKIEAVDKVVYLYVVSHGSLMHRRCYDVMRTRFEVILRCNLFKKQHGLGRYQSSVMYFLAESRHYGTKGMWEFLRMLIKYKQNPFIGAKNWAGTIKGLRLKNDKEKEYIKNEY